MIIVFIANIVIGAIFLGIMFYLGHMINQHRKQK